MSEERKQIPAEAAAEATAAQAAAQVEETAEAVAAKAGKKADKTAAKADKKAGKTAAKADKKADKTAAKAGKKAAKSDPDDPDEPFFRNKKNVVRLVAFIVAFVVAVGAIAFGVYRLGYKEPGSYEITPDADADLPRFASGVRCYYTVTGNSTENRAVLSEVKNAYATALKQAYRLLNAREVYGSTVNIAAINEHIGEPVVVSTELFAVLKDALARTEEGRGFSIYSGLFASMRDALLYNGDPVPQDPANNADARELFALLESAMNSENACRLTLDAAARTACLTVSDEVAAYLAEYGEGAPILDLDAMFDAYRLAYVAKELTKAGWTNGYLVSESGIVLLLPDFGGADFCFYSDAGSAEESAADYSASWSATGGAASCLFRSFATASGEDGYYRFVLGEADLRRSPAIDRFSDEAPAVDSVMAVSPEGDVVSACYEALCLFRSSSRFAALTAAAAMPDGLVWFVDLCDGEKKLYIGQNGESGDETIESGALAIATSLGYYRSGDTPPEP